MVASQPDGCKGGKPPLYFNNLWDSSNKNLLSKDSLQELLSPHSPGGEYGFGFSLHEAEDGLKAISHGGSVAGYNAFIIYEPNSKLGVIMLRNYKGGLIDIKKSSMKLLGILLGNQQ